MASDASAKPTIALLGATGGSILAALVRTLEAGYPCSTLVRTPSKLIQLLNARSVSDKLISSHLNIIEGDCKDPTKVAELLLVNNSIVDIILSGVGSFPVFTPNPLRPTLHDPTICQDTTSTILTALKTLQSRSDVQPSKPVLIVISGTGISNHGRDIPLAMVPLYHWMLPIPHADKKMMENILTDEVKTENENSVIEGFVGVRPSFLTTKPGVGVGAIRVGIEKNNTVDKAAIGYTISRDDVGEWIFEVLLKKENIKRQQELLNKFVMITS